MTTDDDDLSSRAGKVEQSVAKLLSRGGVRDRPVHYDSYCSLYRNFDTPGYVYIVVYAFYIRTHACGHDVNKYRDVVEFVEIEWKSSPSPLAECSTFSDMSM